MLTTRFQRIMAPDGQADDMFPTMTPPTPRYLTTKEVADLLRVKERKVYDLAAAGEIPHRRITGKLLFPVSEITAWIEGEAEAPGSERPAVVSGSHDPLLDWAIRASGAGLAALWNGSLDGLDAFAAGSVALAGLHVPEAEGWNTQTVSARGLSGAVLVGWAVRARGLLLAPDVSGQVRRFADLRARRVVLRQPGAGAAALFDDLMAEAGLDAADIVPSTGLARTEGEAAAAISAGEADAALGIEAMARQFHLDFLPLRSERFDLLVDRRFYFTEAAQTLFTFSRTDTFRDKAAAMGGYDLAEAGAVRWLSP
ncbi:MAG: helix-turn-helix transcriptional regulator [Pseudomonadota bacterium]